MPVPAVVPTLPPDLPRAPTIHVPQETLFSWIGGLVQGSIRNLPKAGKTLAIQLAIVAAVNFILWPINTWRLPTFLAKLVGALVFLTATYNNIIPKTIYWVIIFTFGKRLLAKVRSEGLGRALQPVKGVIPELRSAQTQLRDKAYALLLLGGGLGLIVANNFASYSRFSGARNRMDKYFVVMVISFAVSYMLGESRQGWLFKFSRLAASDLSRLLRRTLAYSDNHTFLLLSGFVGGLLLDAPLILMGLNYGGYILGAAMLAGAAAMPYLPAAGKVK